MTGDAQAVAFVLACFAAVTLFARHRADHARAALARLTDRERAVAFAVAEGQGNAEIAADLFMSMATMKVYVSRI